MKMRFFAGLVIAGTALTATAGDVATQGPEAVAEHHGEAVNANVATESQFRTYQAGSQLLIDISARVGSDLDARMERELAHDNLPEQYSQELLVSRN
ncbi:MAG: hypothetical protein R3228_08450 [Halioglobus sp.]|nr:hypothetical protein [Halioglobus sp.]